MVLVSDGSASFLFFLVGKPITLQSSKEFLQVLYSPTPVNQTLKMSVQPRLSRRKKVILGGAAGQVQQQAMNLVRVRKSEHGSDMAAASFR